MSQVSNCEILPCRVENSHICERWRLILRYRDHPVVDAASSSTFALLSSLLPPFRSFRLALPLPKPALKGTEMHHSPRLERLIPLRTTTDRLLKRKVTLFAFCYPPLPQLLIRFRLPTYRRERRVCYYSYIETLFGVSVQEYLMHVNWSKMNFLIQIVSYVLMQALFDVVPDVKIETSIVPELFIAKHISVYFSFVFKPVYNAIVELRVLFNLVWDLQMYNAPQRFHLKIDVLNSC